MKEVDTLCGFAHNMPIWRTADGHHVRLHHSAEDLPKWGQMDLMLHSSPF